MQTTSGRTESGQAAGPADSGYRLVVRTAIVAGAFSLIVCALLLWDYSRRLTKDPLDSPEFKALKAELAQRPKDEELKKQIRALDLQLRREYFRQRAFARAGTWLLLGGIVLLLIGARSAATLRRKLPAPVPQAMPVDPEIRTSRVGRWSVAALGVVLAGAAGALSVGLRTDVPRSEGELAAMLNPQTTAAQPGAAGAASAAAGYPSEEEIRANWPRFRGPGGLGISAAANVPTDWDGNTGKAILWKTPVPLPGNNSPVIWGNRIFLSGADEKSRKVFCFDTATGKLVWQTQSPGTPQSTQKVPKVLDDTGLAAPTTTTDGRRVFAIFANGDLAAVNFDGKLAWAQSLGMPKNDYGHASSLTMYKNLLLVQFDQGVPKDGLSKLLALDAASGNPVWEARREMPSSWSTPIVINHAGREQIVTTGDPWVIAYDAADGKELWRAKCLRQDVGPSPVFCGGLVYAVSEFPYLSAIGPDGQGDVTQTHVLWTGEDGLPDTCSPLATDQYVFLMSSPGTLTCYEAKKGKKLWEKDFESSFKASPSLVGNRLYLIGDEGKAWVVEPGPEGCREIGKGELGENCTASPAFQDGRMYLRGAKHLFCIGVSRDE